MRFVLSPVRWMKVGPVIKCLLMATLAVLDVAKSEPIEVGQVLGFTPGIRGAVELVFQSEEGKYYQVQVSADMAIWDNEGYAVKGTGGQVSVLARTRNLANAFYRLRDDGNPASVAPVGPIGPAGPPGPAGAQGPPGSNATVTPESVAAAVAGLSSEQVAGLRSALDLPERLHPCAESYVEAVGMRGSATSRISSFFQILDDSELLDEFVDGAYFGTDGNHASGNPVSLRGVPAASIADHFTRSPRGLTATQTSTAGIGFTVTDTRTGTLCVDCVSAGISDLGNGGGVIAVIGNSANSSDSAQLVWNGTSRQELQYFIGGAYQGATSMPTIGNPSNPDNNITREFTRRSLEPQICIWTFGNSDVKCWYNGSPSHPFTAKSNPPAVSVPQNRVSLFARHASASTFTTAGIPLRGTVTSWLLFSRELSDAEAKVATRAMRCLRSEPVTLVIEGDSNGREVSETNPTSHFGWALRSHGRWGEDVWQANISTSGHQINTLLSGNHFAVQARHLRTRDHVRAAHVIFSPLGVNNIGLRIDATPATMWSNMLRLINSYRNMGFTVTVMTIPTVAAPTWDDTQRQQAADYNALLKANAPSGVHVIDTVPLLGSRATHPDNWTDDAHPSGTGWAAVAAQIYAVVGEP